MDGNPNLVLSPHFDDAVFSIGGLIATEPEQTTVVTVFAGVPIGGTAGRWDRRSGFATAEEAMASRAAENHDALAHLGVASRGVRNLDFLDGQYRGDADAGNTDLRALIGAVIRELATELGGEVDLLAPASAWHPDHGVVTDAALDISGTLPAGCRIFLYQDQPYAYLELRRRSPAPLKFANFAVLDRLAERGGCGAAHRRLIELDDGRIALKMRAVAAYASQFPVIRPLLYKMIRDFSRHQARAVGLRSPHVEVLYHLDNASIAER